MHNLYACSNQCRWHAIWYRYNKIEAVWGYCFCQSEEAAKTLKPNGQQRGRQRSLYLHPEQTHMRASFLQQTQANARANNKVGSCGSRLRFVKTSCRVSSRGATRTYREAEAGYRWAMLYKTLLAWLNTARFLS